MIVLEQGLNGYDEGLNGLRIAKFFKRNIKSIGKDVSIKNAIAVAKIAAPIALSFVPVVGGAASSVFGKLLTNVDGSANLIGRIANTVQTVASSNVGKSVIAFAKPLVKNAAASILQQNGEIPNDEQLATLAYAKGTTAQQELDNLVYAKSAGNPAPASTYNLVNAQSAGNPAPASTDNTMLIVGGIAAVGIAYAIFK